MIDVLAIVKKYGLSPRREAGQNFLIDPQVLQNIIKVADLTGRENVLEVGPGPGVLTAELVKQAKKVMAVELDSTMLYALKKEFRTAKNLLLVKDDILKLSFDFISEHFDNQPYQVIANLPYNITSHFIRRFSEADYAPTRMILMIQKEVAERITATPGEMSLLALATQFYFEAHIVFPVGKKSFFPSPKVDSAVIELVRRKKLPTIDQKAFFRLLKIGFSAKRKQLQNNLANGYHVPRIKSIEWLEKAGISIEARAQELSQTDWEKLLAQVEK